MDGEKILMWLKENNPFLKIENEIRSLSTGITSEKVVNCHNAESIGLKIQEKLDNVSLNEAKIKRTDKVICFDTQSNTIIIEKKSEQINPLSALAGREENVTEYFNYELTPYPMSLFKVFFLR